MPRPRLDKKIGELQWLAGVATLVGKVQTRSRPDRVAIEPVIVLEKQRTRPEREEKSGTRLCLGDGAGCKKPKRHQLVEMRPEPTRHPDAARDRRVAGRWGRTIVGAVVMAPILEVVRHGGVLRARALGEAKHRKKDLAHTRRCRRHLHRCERRRTGRAVDLAALAGCDTAIKNTPSDVLRVGRMIWTVDNDSQRFHQLKR